MITPHFECTQDDEFIRVRIEVPYVKVDEMDFYVLGTEFKFFVKPYFLRLTFPNELIEDGRERAEYDVGAGVVTVHLPKQNPGEYFEGLDMLTRLLAKPDRSAPTGPHGNAESGDRPLIEVLDSSEVKTEGEDKDDGAAAETEAGAEAKGFMTFRDIGDPQGDDYIDCEVEQVVQPSLESLTLSSVTYGFNEQYSGVFGRLPAEEVFEMVDLPEPDTTSAENRTSLRTLKEDVDFAPDHYMADFIYSAEEHSAFYEYSLPDTLFDVAELSREEKEALLRLPRKEFLLDSAQIQRRYLLCIVDVLLAHSYDQKFSFGEGNIESGWTITKLSACLSWLDDRPENVKDVLVRFVRRALCYPLIRTKAFCRMVVDDAIRILRGGRKAVLRALLNVKRVLDSAEGKHIHSRLFLSDFCVWIQSLRSKDFEKLSQELRGTTTDVFALADLGTGWPLHELEELAKKELDTEHIEVASRSCSSSSSSASDDSSSASSDSDSSDDDSDTDGDTEDANPPLLTGNSPPATDISASPLIADGDASSISLLVAPQSSVAPTTNDDGGKSSEEPRKPLIEEL